MKQPMNVEAIFFFTNFWIFVFAVVKPPSRMRTYSSPYNLRKAYSLRCT